MAQKTKGYKIHEVLDERTGTMYYCVYEETSEQVVNFYGFRDEAERHKTFLEQGGAFSGFTPAFMLNEVSLPKGNVNEKFVKECISGGSQ